MNTLFDKIWDAHTVRTIDGGSCVLYIDRQYIHEVTSPQAFAGLRRRGIEVFRPQQVTASPDHNIPTQNQHLPIAEPQSAAAQSHIAHSPDTIKSYFRMPSDRYNTPQERAGAGRLPS